MSDVAWIESNTYVNDLCRFVNVWKSGQTCLPKVIRWEKYLQLGSIRQQDCLAHSYSITFAGSFLRFKLAPFICRFNWQLFMDCLLVHDHGEGELGSDVLYHFKTQDHDLQEYLAFKKRFQQLGKEAYAYYERAFLLQFCLKNPENFPKDAREIMAGLAEKYSMEALLFEAVERWDCVLFAWEQYQDSNNKFLLAGVLHSQFARLCELCGLIPGFGQEILPPDVRKEWQRFLEDNQNLVEEFKTFLGLTDQK